MKWYILPASFLSIIVNSLWPCSSSVERCPEEAGVASSILAGATIYIIVMHYVYILQSEKDGAFYTGMTSDIKKRLAQHSKGITKTTKSRRPWKLVYSETFKTKAEARTRELYWKSGIGREERNLKLGKQA